MICIHGALVKAEKAALIWFYANRELKMKSRDCDEHISTGYARVSNPLPSSLLSMAPLTCFYIALWIIYDSLVPSHAYSILVPCAKILAR